MSDVYVYNFYPFAAGGERHLRSLSYATLTAIETIGTPIMESQAVIDASQLSADGHLLPFVESGSLEFSRLSAEIRSLEIRAAARDRLANSMDAKADEAAIYMLSLESRHLRQQSHRLTVHRAEILAAESGHISDRMALPYLSV